MMKVHFPFLSLPCLLLGIEPRFSLMPQKIWPLKLPGKIRVLMSGCVNAGPKSYDTLVSWQPL